MPAPASIPVAEIQRTAHEWIERAAKNPDPLAREMRLEWAAGLAMLLHCNQYSGVATAIDNEIKAVREAAT